MDSFMRPQVLTLMLLLFCWELVNCQVPVPGYIGENVTLPCNFKQPLSQTDEVFWRDRNDDNVLEIIGGEPKSEKQNKKYKDRVFILQDGYNNGNVSISMTNLRPDDAGTYTCTLLPDSVPQTVRLTISEKPAKKTTGPSDGAAGTKILSVALLSALSLLLCF